MKASIGALTGAILAACAGSYAQIPVWHNLLDDLTSSTINGGAQQGSVPTYSSFGLPDDNNGYVSTSDSRFFWGTSQVQSIFTGWVDAQGITIDLFVRGFDSSTMSGDLGLWSVGHRNADNFILVQFQNNALRVVIRGDSGVGSGTSYAFGTQSGSAPFEPPIPLTLDPNTTYRVTVRQHSSLNTANNKLGLGLGGDLEVYLEGGVYSGLLGSLDLPTNYSFNFPLETGSGPALGMSVGYRHPFTATPLTTGQGIDNVRIYNGSYAPSEIPVAGPGLPVAIAVADVASGFVPLTVHFDGSASFDVGPGTITGYAWDFDNDGTIDDTTGSIVSHQYLAAGSYLCKLTVTDNDNHTAEDTVAIQVNTLPATGLLAITAMEPSEALPAGPYMLTSVTSQRIGTAEAFTTTDLIGPPDTAHVEVTGAMSGGGAGATTAAEAMVGLELGSTVSGLSGEGEFLAGYFPGYAIVQPDGTNAPELFVVESSASTDSFQIQLLTNASGATIAIAATLQVRSIDYASTSTVIGGTPRGGVGIDLDALGVTGIRGVRLTGADGFGGASGVDPVLVAALLKSCNTPFADFDGDHDVDMDDFGEFQACYTGASPFADSSELIRCFCFDREGDQDADEFDFRRFADCATGPAIQWDQGLTPDCIP